jgi:hypothetical protein
MEQITAELKICALLQECSRESVITSSQFVQGFLVPSSARLMTFLLTFFMHLGPEGYPDPLSLNLNQHSQVI